MAETINFQRDPQNGPRRYPLLITGALGFALAVTPAYADTNWSTSDESLVITLDDMCSKVAEGALICKEGESVLYGLSLPHTNGRTKYRIIHSMSHC